MILTLAHTICPPEMLRLLGDSAGSACANYVRPAVAVAAAGLGPLGLIGLALTALAVGFIVGRRSAR